MNLGEANKQDRQTKENNVSTSTRKKKKEKKETRAKRKLTHTQASTQSGTQAHTKQKATQTKDNRQYNGTVWIGSVERIDSNWFVYTKSMGSKFTLQILPGQVCYILLPTGGQGKGRACGG
jgi:ATP-dependent 26S proteasome regulatory subunit